MKTVLYIVARLGSTRVPKKNILSLNGIPMIIRTYNQVKKISGIDKIRLATTESPIDDELVEVAKKHNLDVFRGHSEYVLDRVFHAASEDKAKIILYAGGDGPLIDPEIYSKALKDFKSKKINFLTCYEPQTFPGGYDFNIIDFNSLKIAYEGALVPSQRINMFSFFTFNDTEIQKLNFENEKDLSETHFSLDYPEDIDFFNLMFSEIDAKGAKINLENTLKIIKDNEELSRMRKNLSKPKSSNALFNSVHIMKGFFKDIEFLMQLAKNEKDTNVKEKYLIQASKIAKKLSE